MDVVDLARVEDGFREILEANRKPWRKGPIGRRDWIQGVLADACKAIDYGLTASASSDARGPKFLRITDIVSGHIDWSSVPYVTVDDAMRAKYQLHDGDIVIARTGASTGASAFVKAPPDAVFASYLVRLQARKGYDARFLAYSLKSDQFWNFLRGVLGDKSAQPNASASTITRGPLRAPRCQTEQRAIGRVLGALDDRIDMNRRMNETLEAMARALFKSWFVDFDPVRAKMEGHDTGLPPDIADLFPDRLVESELGQIPEGWRTFGMQDLAELHKNTMDPSILGDSDVEHFSIPAFDAGRVPKVQPGRSIRSNKTVVPTKAVLLSKLNPETSRVWVPHSPRALPQLCSTEFLAFTPKRHVSRSLLYGLFTSRGFRGLLMGMVTGTSKSHQRVQPRALAGTTVLAGTAALFDCYDRMISGLLESVPRHRLQMQRLGDIRDSLLPKLVAGEIRLPAALVSEAA